jgi:hypothetical protein
VASLKDNLHAYLAARAGLTGIVGTRIYRDRLPAASKRTNYPALLFRRVGGPATYYQGGETATGTVRVEFTALAETDSEVDRVVEALRDAMSGFRGTFGTGETATTVLLVSRTGDTVDTPYEPIDGTDSPIFSTSVDYEIHYRQSKPTFA